MCINDENLFNFVAAVVVVVVVVVVCCCFGGFQGRPRYWMPYGQEKSFYQALWENGVSACPPPLLGDPPLWLVLILNQTDM